MSELLLSDKLLHEENARVITELRESNYVKEQEIQNLRQSLRKATEKQKEGDKRLKASQAQLQSLKLENKECKAELTKK